MTPKSMFRLIGTVSPLLCVALVNGFGVWKCGSLGGLAAFVRGDSLYMEFPGHMGDLSSGTTSKADIRVKNLRNHDIELLGGSTDCSCIKFEGLPRRIPARAECLVTVAVEVEGHGKREHSLALIASTPSASSFPGTISFSAVRRETSNPVLLMGGSRFK